MRCKNCGWVNPDGQTQCEKCHAALSEAAAPHSPTTPVSDRMKSTIAEGVIFPDSAAAGPNRTCPRCGYPVSEGSAVCPNCNHELQSAPTLEQPAVPAPQSAPRIQRAGMGTVMSGPVAGPQSGNRFCTLRPIAWEGEEVSYNPITYSGETIILNRANTDANNNSITSREQAILTFEDGEWFIENRSDLRTTFIRVNGKVKLTRGDIIVLGNREFEFKG
ncbi:MAG: hypothetical protein HDS64_06240 [Bacteroidales bacterium]|nr:hypothetical protein [Bacteroidales bacterium]